MNNRSKAVFFNILFISLSIYSAESPPATLSKKDSSSEPLYTLCLRNICKHSSFKYRFTSLHPDAIDNLAKTCQQEFDTILQKGKIQAEDAQYAAKLLPLKRYLLKLLRVHEKKFQRAKPGTRLYMHAETAAEIDKGIVTDKILTLKKTPVEDEAMAPMLAALSPFVPLATLNQSTRFDRISVASIEYILATMAKQKRPCVFDITEFFIERVFDRNLARAPYRAFTTSTSLDSSAMRTRLLEFMRKSVEYRHTPQLMTAGLACALNMVEEHRDDRFKEVIPLFHQHGATMQRIKKITDAAGKQRFVTVTSSMKTNLKRTRSFQSFC